MPKNNGTTLLLNFLIPGSGHVYASDGKEWGLLAANIVCAFTGALLILPWFALPFIWIIAMHGSSSVTQRYNQLELEGQEEELWEAEQRRSAEMEAKEREAAQRAREEAARLKSEAIDAKRVTGSVLSQKMARLHPLQQTGVLSGDEVSRERAKLIAEALTGWTDEELADFMSPFAELKLSGALDSEALSAVKTVYGGLSKSRPQ